MRELPECQNSTAELRILHDHLHKLLLQLQNEGQNVNQELIKFLIQEKLPPSVIIDINKKKNLKAEFSKEESAEDEIVEDLMRDLNEYIRIKEGSLKMPRSEAIPRTLAPIKERLGHKRHEGFTKAAVVTEEFSERACVFCGMDHFNDQCIQYETIEQRSQRAKELLLCHRCLKKGHNEQACRSTRECHYCKSKAHNRALCRRKANFAISYNATRGRRTARLKPVSYCDRGSSFFY